MNENEFKLQFYFNLYKDKSMINSSMFRAKFKKLHGDFKYLDKLVVEIENYQIKKYGCTLGNGSMDKNSTPERIRKLWDQTN